LQHVGYNRQEPFRRKASGRKRNRLTHQHQATTHRQPSQPRPAKGNLPHEAIVTIWSENSKKNAQSYI
jgi:hypothetical protein